MMTFTQGNLLDASVEALVNTVNTVGVMGKGIALMFKEAFPANFRAYEEACEQKQSRLEDVRDREPDLLRTARDYQLPNQETLAAAFETGMDH